MVIQLEQLWNGRKRTLLNRFPSLSANFPTDETWQRMTRLRFLHMINLVSSSLDVEIIRQTQISGPILALGVSD